MASKNSWVIAWLDANFNESDDNRDTQKKLAPLCQTLRGFTNENECSAFIKSEPKKNIIVLVSGRLSRAIVPENHDKSQISAFFLYCMNIDPHIDWSKSFNKVYSSVRKIILGFNYFHFRSKEFTQFKQI